MFALNDLSIFILVCHGLHTCTWFTVTYHVFYFGLKLPSYCMPFTHLSPSTTELLRNDQCNVREEVQSNIFLQNILLGLNSFPSLVAL